MSKLPEYRIIMWDWKETPDMGEFTEAAKAGFTTFGYIPYDGEMNVVLATKKSVTPYQVDAILQKEQAEEAE